MKTISFLTITLASLFLAFCCNKKIPPEFTEKSTTTRQLTTLYLSLPADDGLPCSIIFYPPRTLIEPPAIRSDGVPYGISVMLTQKGLEQLRATINKVHCFQKLKSYQSRRSPDTKIPAPDFPHIKTKLAQKATYSLQVRSNSIYQNAHYICEFAELKERKEAEDFLKSLKEKTGNEKVQQAIQQLLKRS